MILNILHRNRRHLTDHRIKRKRDTRRDRNTLRSSPGIEDLGGDNPGQRTTGCGEGEVVEPGHYDETPVSAAVDCCWWEFGEEDCGDDECYAVAQVAAD